MDRLGMIKGPALWLEAARHAVDTNRMQSMSENDFECSASTGGKTAPVAMFPDSAPMSIRFPRSRAPAILTPSCFTF